MGVTCQQVVGPYACGDAPAGCRANSCGSHASRLSGHTLAETRQQVAEHMHVETRQQVAGPCACGDAPAYASDTPAPWPRSADHAGLVPVWLRLFGACAGGRLRPARQ
eukprot:364227-Chlamydomonas_euryale.AAC.8